MEFEYDFRGTIPYLKVGIEIYYGINIIEKLQHMIRIKTHMSHHDEYDSISISKIVETYEEACTMHLKKVIPTIGFVLNHPRAVVPTKTIDNVGYDLTTISVFKKQSSIRTLYETHVAVNIPLGFYIEIVPRSSMSKTGYMMSNSIGIIDPGFTGTLKIPLIKIDPEAPELELPATIAQLILKPYVVSIAYETTENIKTTRGDGGFGSTNQY